MRNSESLFPTIRGLRYHVRRWPRAGAPKMVLLHGWMDVSASFQFMVDALRPDSGVDRSHVSAQTVADQIDRSLRREPCQQEIQIGQIIG